MSKKRRNLRQRQKRNRNKINNNIDNSGSHGGDRRAKFKTADAVQPANIKTSINNDNIKNDRMADKSTELKINDVNNYIPDNENSANTGYLAKYIKANYDSRHLMVLLVTLFALASLIFAYISTSYNYPAIDTHLKTIATANKNFFARYKIWPTDASSGGNRPYAASIAVLKGVPVLPGGAVYNSKIDFYSLVDYLPYLFYRADYSAVWHEFGSGGTVYESAVNNPDNLAGRYLVVEMSNVQIDKARQIERQINDVNTNEDNPQNRLFITANSNVSCFNKLTKANPETTGLVNICYAANRID